jgi:sugar/nucleoside kinase (ribokinase family)
LEFLWSLFILLFTNTHTLHFFFSFLQDEVANATGAGDTFCGALIHSLITKPDLDIDKSIDFAMKAAVMSIKFKDGAVADDLKRLLD